MKVKNLYSTCFLVFVLVFLFACRYENQNEKPVKGREVFPYLVFPESYIKECPAELWLTGLMLSHVLFPDPGEKKMKNKNDHSDMAIYGFYAAMNKMVEEEKNDYCPSPDIILQDGVLTSVNLTVGHKVWFDIQSRREKCFMNNKSPYGFKIDHGATTNIRVRFIETCSQEYPYAILVPSEYQFQSAWGKGGRRSIFSVELLSGPGTIQIQAENKERYK